MCDSSVLVRVPDPARWPRLRALLRLTPQLLLRARVGQRVALCLLSSCGRVGVELLPLEWTPPPDPPADHDASPDAQSADGSSDAQAADADASDAGVPCAAGYADCDGEPLNGCESDLSSVDTCGSCDERCANPHGAATCGVEGCLLACAPGFGDCDGDPATGCEANLDSDPARCGSCTVACDPLLQICVNGQCQASPCPPGFAECDGNPTVVCETDIRTTAAHCGFCNNACALAHATSQCVAGTCQVASCQADWGDCDTTRPDGCETSLTTASNCGRCGDSCPANGGTPICSAGTCGTRCDLSGTFALKIELRSSWSQAQYVASGSGTHEFWLRLQGTTHSGDNVVATLIECGRSVPDFRALSVNETFHFDLPDSVFDQVPSDLPSSMQTITLSSSSPGAQLTLPATAFMLGATMPNPVTDPWPSSASGLSQVDMDGDGNPGVTLRYLNGNGYIYPRVGGTLFSDRAQRPYSATRLVFALSGTLDSCSQASGPATVTHIETRIFGCEISGGGECNSSEASFLDQNCVDYQLGSASYRLVKVANNGSCADVRAALP